MDIEKLINEKIQRLQDLNKQMQGLNTQIGALQEQGRALHQAALEIKGAVEGLAELKAKTDEEAKAAEKALLLPDKSLVAADGKTVLVAEAAPAADDAPSREATDKPVSEMIKDALPEKAPVTLEVK